MRWWFVGAAILGVLNAAVAATYYLRIVAVMYFRTPLATPRAEGGDGAWWAAVACALLLIGVGVYPASADPGGGRRERRTVGRRRLGIGLVWSVASESTREGRHTSLPRNLV